MGLAAAGRGEVLVSDADDNDLKNMLRRHAELEELQGDGGQGRFLSGWQCDHPWTADLRAAVAAERLALPDGSYHYLDHDERVLEGLVSFHRSSDGALPPAIVPGEGGTALLATICAWFQERDVTEVFFLPPLYFSVAHAFRLLGMRARAVSGRHAFESAFSINLPEQKTVLFLTDPVWYAGLTVDTQVIEKIADWQRRTKSFVVVDGCFQYMRWDGLAAEATSRLDPDRTIRVLCPTKTLALHGYRFAYAILPANMRASFVHLYATLFGSASAESVAFARVAVREMGAGSLAKKLIAYVADRHRRLRTAGKIASGWEPNSGYFVFERILKPDFDIGALMDGSYFGQKRYPDYRRINLLSPSLHLLGSDDNGGSFVHFDKGATASVNG